MTKKNPFKDNKHEILYNIINSLIAGCLVFLGAVSDGNFNSEKIFISIFAALIIMLYKFQNYWDSQKDEYTNKLFNFI